MSKQKRLLPWARGKDGTLSILGPLI